jgi:hypothetical protein
VTPNRRSLLERIAAVTVVGLAGCADDGSPTDRSSWRRSQPSQNSPGLRRYRSMVKAAWSNRSQTPSSPRKSGTPEAVLTPAPVRATTESAARTVPANAPTSSMVRVTRWKRNTVSGSDDHHHRLGKV